MFSIDHPTKQLEDKSLIVGIDIGGTNIKVAFISVSRDKMISQIIDKIQIPTPRESKSDLIEAVKSALENLPNGFSDIAAIGVASPGLVNRESRLVSWMQGRMECLVGLDWTQELGERVLVLNDAQAALQGERWIGAAKGSDNVVMLTLGTGVGGAAVVNGTLLKGALGRAGHLGHISLNPRGKLDIVGTPGSLEDLVGDATIESRSGGCFSSTTALVEAVARGEEPAQEIWLDSIEALAAGITSLINVLDPEIFLLGGGIANAGDHLFKPLNQSLQEIEWRPFGEPVPIVPALLGEWAGAIGAAHSSIDSLLTQPNP